MARAYTLKRRAEQQADTRQRIVEAAVHLHSTVGPASTTTSMIAEAAGVQRHTVYAHFPDAWSMVMACSGHVFDRDPLPEVAACQEIADQAQRLTACLSALYPWYRRNAEVTAAVLRDAEHHELTREIAQFRMGATMAGYAALIGADSPAQAQALWRLALSFHTWRTLALEAQLSDAQAVSAMVEAVAAAT
jgi:AcrR family transcriptional regulator